MLEELRHRILAPLDVAIERAIENWRLLLALVPGGTLLFLFLLLVFGTSFLAVFLLGFFVIVLEAGIGSAIFLLDVKYRPQLNEWSSAADAIEAQISGDDVFGDWDDFIAGPADDPELEDIRAHCARLPQEHPPDQDGDYCNDDGVEVLDSHIKHLRTGLATKGAEVAWTWWTERRAARRRKKGGAPARPKKTRGGRTEAVQQLPRMTVGGSGTEIVDRRQADREAEIEARRAEKEEARAQKKAEKLARKSVKRAEKLALKAPHKLEQIPDPLAPQPMQGQVDEDDWEEEEEEQEVAPAPPPRRKPGVLTEAAALELIMESGYTAHDYDRVQHLLASHLGRQPKPPEVVKAMFSRTRLKRAARSRPRSRKARKAARRTARQARAVKMRQPRSKAPLVFMTVIGALAGAPFAAWRLPVGDPITIEGEVRFQALDTPPNLTHELRTQFEAMFGNKAVSLINGPRLYVSETDYDLCWPESWSAIYDKGYSMIVVAEVRPTLIGDYTVAHVSDVKRIDSPVAVLHDQ